MSLLKRPLELTCDSALLPTSNSPHLYSSAYHRSHDNQACSASLSQLYTPPATLS